MKSPEAVLRWLRMVKQDHWYITQAQISWTAIEAMHVMSKDRIERAKRGMASHAADQRGISDDTCAALTPVIVSIERGELVFAGDARGRRMRAVWLDVPEPMPRAQDSIVLDEHWIYWARCRRCDGNKWLPITLADKAQVACYQCHPVDEYPSYGALARKARLVERMLSEYFERYATTDRDMGIIPGVVVTTNRDPYWRKQDRVIRDGRPKNLALSE